MATSEAGLARLAEARELFVHARAENLATSEERETSAREALAKSRSALDWLEGTDRFEEAHDLLHEIGRFVRSTWGCTLVLDKQGYWRECPADLAHIRMGMSPGIVILASECSICGREPRECDHIKGRVYEGERCVRRITEMEIVEVSFVARPAQPDARLQRVSVTPSHLQGALGPQWKPGQPASCDRCLGACQGFITYPADAIDHSFAAGRDHFKNLWT